MPSRENNRNFTATIIPEFLLDDAVEWIESHLQPDEVFSVETLESWALDHEFIKKDD
jgi:hypothetical protein